MNQEIKIFPLIFDLACEYVTDQLRNGNSLANELLNTLDFKQGHFFALLHSSIDTAKIHNFGSGGILIENPLESVTFNDKLYLDRKKMESIQELILYLKSVMRPGHCCFFEDVIHRKTDLFSQEIKNHILYFQEEIYLYLKNEEFTDISAERLIRYSDAQWYYMNIISKEDPGSDPNITRQMLQKIAFKTSQVILGAYDMEGFVVWNRYPFII